MRAAIAAAMGKSNREIPHYYMEITIDMSKSLEWLKEINKERPVNKRVLPVALLISAVAKALQNVPELNASWENGIRLKEEINPGLVISLKNKGVVIPAIHRADQKSTEEIMDVLMELIPRAKDLRLKSSELSNSTITITSLGDDGPELVYGVIYPPQVALIGFGSIREQAWAENGMLGIRPVITATLAADHRATDGHIGYLFLKALKEKLLKPEKL